MPRITRYLLLGALLGAILPVTAGAATAATTLDVSALSARTEPGRLAVKVLPGREVPDLPGITDITPAFPGADADPRQGDLARWFALDVVVGLEDTLLDLLAAVPGVAVAERIPYGIPATDPRSADQWHLDTIEAPRAWRDTPGSGLRLGIIDTQFEATHPDLAGVLEDRLGNRGTYDAYESGCPAGVEWADHGTLVAGTAAAAAENGRGGKGVAYAARVVAIQAGVVSGDACLVSGAWVAALRDLATDGVPVVNLSFATSETSVMASDAVRFATNAGTLVVAAAGNSATTTPHYPAAEPSVIGVAASTRSDTLWSSSNRGPWVDLAAPGDRILTTCAGGTYCYTAGTSIATPMVAATALLVAEESGPNIRGTRLRSRVLDAADALSGTSPTIGRGRLDAGAAVVDDAVRLFGAHRVATAAAISIETNSRGDADGRVVDRVVVVPGNAPNDLGWTMTLPAAGLLNDERTAILVSDRDRLSPEVAAELRRLSGGADLEVLLPGSTTTGVGAAVEAELEVLYGVRRVAGNSAADTAALLADIIVGETGARKVLVARGDTFADALTLSGPAAAFGYPLLFVATGSVPQSTCDWLAANTPTTIHVAGGTAAVSDSVVADLRECGTEAPLFGARTVPTVLRDAGASRVETAVAIARRHFGDNVRAVSVANGWKWPDAVAGGALAVTDGAPILVVPSDAVALPSPVAAYVAETTPQDGYVLGGPVVVAPAVEADLEARVD